MGPFKLIIRGGYGITRITCWSALILESLRWTVHSVLRADAIWSFWYTIFLPHVSVYWILWLLHFGWLLVLSLYLDDDLPMFKCVSFCLHGCCGEWEGWSLKPNNKTNWMAVVTLILPFSFGFVRGIRTESSHRTESDLFTFFLTFFLTNIYAQFTILY